jgi:hypothetical protein
MKGLRTSPRTTLGAILSFLLLIAIQLGHILDNNPATVAEWENVAAAIPLLVALCGAQDAKD